jgi:hypothetical protein
VVGDHPARARRSALIGSERAGRVMVAMGTVMIVLRLITRAAVSFKPEA